MKGDIMKLTKLELEEMFFVKEELEDANKSEKNFAKWKKAFTANDLSEAFAKAIGESPAKDNAMLLMVMVMFATDVLAILFPKDEYDVLFPEEEEKGGKDAKTD